MCRLESIHEQDPGCSFVTVEFQRIFYRCFHPEMPIVHFAVTAMFCARAVHWDRLGAVSSCEILRSLCYITDDLKTSE